MAKLGRQDGTSDKGSTLKRDRASPHDQLGIRSIKQTFSNTSMNNWEKRNKFNSYENGKLGGSGPVPSGGQERDQTLVRRNSNFGASSYGHPPCLRDHG